MKLGVSMWSVVSAVRSGAMDIFGFLDYMTGQDADGVELLDYFWTDQKSEQPRVKAYLNDSRLELLSYSTSNDFFHPDQNERTRELDKLKRVIDTAANFEVDRIRVFSGNHKEGLSFEDGLEWIIEGLGAAAAYAEPRGIVLALENHGLMAGRSDQVGQIIDAVDSPSLRANLDTGNFLLVGQNPTDAARDLADRVALVHLKDFRQATEEDDGRVYTGLDGIGYVGTAVGDGAVDLPAILDILAEAGYDGWLSLEYEGDPDPLTIGVPRSLAAARKLLSK